MFILSKSEKKMISTNQLRWLELVKGGGWHGGTITANFDVNGVYTIIARYDNYEEAEAVFLELCYTIENTNDPNTIIDMDSFGKNSIYKR